MKTFDEAFTELLKTPKEKLFADHICATDYMSNPMFIEYIHTKVCAFFHELEENKQYGVVEQACARILHSKLVVNGLLAAELHMTFQSGVLVGMNMEKVREEVK